MIVAGHLSGGAPVLKKFQIGEAIPLAGVPLEASVLANVDGVVMCETTECLMAIGLAEDAAPTRNTAQQSDGSDPAVYVTVNVRPDVIMNALLSGGSTSGTALTEITNTAASTDGLTLTFAATQATYDDGVMWGATGANAGILRKVTAVTTTATPIIAYKNDVAVGDTFYASTFHKGERQSCVLTTDLTQLNATSSGSGGNDFRILDFYHKAKGERGATQTNADIVFCEHIFRFSGTAAS